MSEDLKKIGIVFMGTSSFADVILNSLIGEKYNVVGVYTQTDKKAGRSQNLQKSAVKITAEKNNIRVYHPEKFDETAVRELEKIRPALIIVAAYGKILPKKVLEIPKYKCINVHASLLPEYRGPSPIQNALLDGKKETGVTIMLMNESVDAGDILAQEKISIHPDEIYPELLGKLAGVSSSLLLEIIPGWAEGKVSPQKQDSSQATLCQLIEKDNGRILWSDEAQDIYNRYRAFYSWPGVFSFWENNETDWRIKFQKISLFPGNPKTGHSLGEVFELEGKFAVQAAFGAIILEEIQLEGKSSVKIRDFINGHLHFIGSILK
jgi:methionyl-tRNA formyltransferase